MNRATKTALTAALPFMMLPLTVAGPLPTAGAAAAELPPGPATVLHTGPTPWSTPTNLGGIICELERECREVYYQWVLPFGTFEPGLAENVKTMNYALNTTDGDKVAYGFSGGARVVSKWLEDYADATAISPDELSMVLLGNGGRKYGGINGWWGGYGDSLMTPTDTQFSVLDVARQYDPIADFPDNPFNLLALANAISAFGNVHMNYTEADLNAPGNYVWTEGNTTYVYIPTAQLPLLQGLRSWGLGAVADQWEAPLREIIDRAYDREYLADAEIIGEDADGDTGNSSTPVQPVAATIPTGPGEACSGYNTDGCDIHKEQSYTPITAPNLANPAWQNVLPNLFNALISVPRAYLDGLNDLSHALEVTGSWWVYTPTNVLGYDPADPPKITAVTNLLIPFKPLSNALGEHVSWWAKANLPMNAGCTGTAPPTCQDAEGILGKMFLAPLWDLIAGYTMPELNNPVSEEEGQAGEEIPGQEGEPVPWSGEHVQLNPWDPVYNTLNYLFAPPEQNRPEPITLTEVVESVVRFTKAVWLDFNPFVPGSFLWKGYPYTMVTPFLKPFVKLLCPSCDPEHPEDPTPGDGILPPSSEEQDTEAPEAPETTEDSGGDAALLVSSTEEGTEVEDEDVVSSAVNDLLEKFKLAPQEEEEAPVDETSGDDAGQEQPADEVTDEAPVAEDEGKPEAGTPAEPKPETGVDEGLDEGDEGDEDKVTEPEDEDEAEDDKRAEVEDSEKPSTGGKHRKADTDAPKESQDKGSDSDSDSGSDKESAGASSGGSDSGE
ncbi:PE-PPE domain-containing protein [Mycobacterium sp. NAZ190054]|uniref:PE-PPE domain-containing protein n=1 Tax=Mycobacterium sp. NAZ190054 TaxID=1747766 RepID=UPI000799073B|nr:PE-PPE domain-containing protein [Mycobacterium sp. NAZ190054]KWX66709.1 PE-PPE domain-containing protein [Mycobacterium sp. NAZ190054]